MATYSVNWSAVLAATAGTVAVGNCLVQNSAGKHYVGTSANRVTYGRCVGIAATAGDADTPVTMIESGIVPASVSGLAAGAASWVRVSSSGTLERVTPGAGDDLIGKAHADGSVQLHPGVWDSNNYSGGSGGSFTAAGDLSGDGSSQTVEKVKGTTITTAGGALAAGAVLRATAVGTADWGAVNLADTDAVTGTLPKGNQGAQDLAGDVTGNTGAAVVAKVNGATYPAAGSLTTGTIPRVTGSSAVQYGALDLANASAVTGSLPKGNQGVQDMAGDVTGSTAVSVVAKVHGATVPAAGALSTGNAAYVSNVSALTYSALNLAGGNGWISGTLPVGNGGTGITSLGTGVATWFGTPSGANLASALSSVLPLTSVGSPTSTGLVKVSAGAWVSAAATLVNADVSSSAAIDYSKMGASAQSLSAVTSFVTTVDAKCTVASREPVHVQTTDATVTTLDSVSLGNATGSTVVTWIVSAIKSDASAAAGYSVSAIFKNNAGTVAQVGTTTVTVLGETNSAWDCTIDNSTSTLRLRVTGAAATTIQWGATGSAVTTVP